MLYSNLRNESKIELIINRYNNSKILIFAEHLLIIFTFHNFFYQKINISCQHLSVIYGDQF